MISPWIRSLGKIIGKLNLKKITGEKNGNRNIGTHGG
jgi:hypothetical protein